MWLPDRRIFLLGLGASALAALSGCTLTPVHGRGADERTLSLRYADPDSRLQQVFYRAFSARAGTSSDPDAPVLSIALRISDNRVGFSETAVSTPLTEYQIIATGNYWVTRNGEVLASGQRTATGGYQRTGQVVANDAARADAEERVVVALAETIRLALISQLGMR